MSSNLNIKTELFGKTERRKFGKIEEIMEIPDLVEVQKNSYKSFITKGIRDVLRDFSPITDTDNLNRSDAREDNTDSRVELYFLDHSFEGKPKYTEAECKSRDATYAMPLKVRVRLVYKETGEVVDQEVYMGDIPIMTDNGSFIINGAERAIVSQLVKSPSVYCSEGINKAGKNVVETDIIPARGAWIEWEEDSNGVLWVHIDRSRKMVGTIFLRALGLSSNEELLEMFDNDPTIAKTIEKDSTTCKEEALVEISKRLRPGEVVNYKAIQKDLEKRFYSTRRYDITGVGRHKFNQKLSLANRIEGKTLAEDIVIGGEVYAAAGEVLDLERARYVQNAGVNKVAVEGKLSKFYVLGNNRVDITAYTGLDAEKAEIDEDVHLPTLLALLDGVTSTEEKQKIIEENRDELMGRHVLLDDILSSVNYHLCLKQGLGSYDDVDHLGNRRIKTVGELLQAQFFIGMARLERVISERMQTQNVEEISPSTLINVRPISAAIREFFGSSQMSQFMEQTNPIASLTHKRKVSSIGPGALTRERAGFDVRDVHYTHYGRLCPNETPEGQNIGLINSLATYAKIDKYGFVEAPYRRIDKATGKVTNEVIYMTADVEEKYVIAQANEELTPEGTLKNKTVTCRKKGEITELPREQIDFIDVSPKELVSIATTLVPFIENDDTTRAMMASNMQRQAVPLLKTEAPIVGTGTEHKIAVDSGVMVVSKHDGTVKYVSGDRVILATDEGDVAYELIPFVRSNNGTCMRQRPIVTHGQEIKKGDVLADGPSTKNGELSIGKNILVAFMPWEGYNFDDAILISDELVEEDVLTSVHIEEYEQDARDTKLGPEEITRDIPNISEEARANLDENGIIRIGAEVTTGDILVGKVTPKGETELTPEERLLRAIFGEKAREVRDTSLRVQHGEGGVVVDVKVFTRENKDELSTGVNKLVRVYIAQKRKMSVGDKMSGRHVNKGVVSRVLPKADM
ncbi:MAG: DNA-directed RNA polymerase subunit beta, partial [Clostridia bacterium]|nr:DNA-directed RNA polymerase subunit beta [Clostridia bacterium]